MDDILISARNMVVLTIRISTNEHHTSELEIFLRRIDHLLSLKHRDKKFELQALKVVTDVWYFVTKWYR